MHRYPPWKSWRVAASSPHSRSYSTPIGICQRSGVPSASNQRFGSAHRRRKRLRACEQRLLPAAAAIGVASTCNKGAWNECHELIRREREDAWMPPRHDSAVASAAAMCASLACVLSVALWIVPRGRAGTVVSAGVVIPRTEADRRDCLQVMASPSTRRSSRARTRPRRQRVIMPEATASSQYEQVKQPWLLPCSSAVARGLTKTSAEQASAREVDITNVLHVHVQWPRQEHPR